MNRNFENKAVIKALNMYGRVPETWELLEEIEKLNNIIKEVREYIEKEYLSKLDDFERPLRMTNKDDWNKILEKLEGVKI